MSVPWSGDSLRRGSSQQLQPLAVSQINPDRVRQKAHGTISGPRKQSFVILRAFHQHRQSIISCRSCAAHFSASFRYLAFDCRTPDAKILPWIPLYRSSFSLGPFSPPFGCRILAGGMSAVPLPSAWWMGLVALSGLATVALVRERIRDITD
jgi:hypothetical protein